MIRGYIFRFSAVAFVVACLLVAASFGSTSRYQATGLLLSGDSSKHAITVSCNEIPGYMDAMVMSFPVSGTLPEGLQPGVTIRFTLVVEKTSSYAEGVLIVPFESLELDPTQARRLKLLEKAISTNPSSSDVLQMGEPVPEFHLTDQNDQAISLSDFSGRVVALTFIYTRCPRPDYCVRLSNNFGVLQRRFATRMGRDLILLTVVIDPVHDQPDALREYARTWKAEARSWHFLTGSVSDIQQLCHRLNMSFYPDEALFVHSFHTVVIGRAGQLIANLEGNDFTAKQLGDLIQLVVDKHE
ncbi:MAG TPA: SCO family protein [Candidatus Sulfotelmatobacter sp.]|nr:SCO family protein [Candidatus Sulfotelmatobacter sp.]